MEKTEKNLMLLFNALGLLFFRPVEGNEISFNSWIEVKKEQYIVLLEAFDITAPAAIRWSALEAASSTAAWRSATGGIFEDDYKKALKKAKVEYETTGKIEGFLALLVGENKLIWISHYDVEELKKQQ